MLALLVIALVSTLALRLVGIARVHRNDSAAYAAQVRLDAVLHSGLHLMRSVLLADRRLQGHDTLFDPWNRLTGSELQQQPHQPELRLEVRDLSGRLQVNALVGLGTRLSARLGHERRQREIWQRLLTSGLFGPMTDDDAQALVDALSDWIDGDESPRPAGAESDWYQQTEGHGCRNGPVTTMEELLLIRGITQELLYGAEGRPGLADFVTVVGNDGLVNINTAPSEVLRAMGVDKRQLADMLAFRSDETRGANLARPDWPGQVHVTLPKELVTTASSAFIVQLEATESIFHRRAEAVILRDASGQTTVLSWWLR